jgi:hypothetical protein
MIAPVPKKMDLAVGIILGRFAFRGVLSSVSAFWHGSSAFLGRWFSAMEFRLAWLSDPPETISFTAARFESLGFVYCNSAA